jgi:integrase/recombinase XerD
MLEHCFVRPVTVDRIRDSWIGAPIEQYVDDLGARGYSMRSMYRRVPMLVAFGAFAWARGARSLAELPEHVEPFVLERVPAARVAASPDLARRDRNLYRSVAEGMIEIALPGWCRVSPRSKPNVPFSTLAPGFWDFLRDERGLSEATVRHYAHWLRRFEEYLQRVGCTDVASLSPPLLSAFVTETAARGYAASTVGGSVGVLRTFLRYAHARGLVARDLSLVVEAPQQYRLAVVPRSISWDEVRRMLEVVDRRSVVGRRDYAMLLLLVTYGLRAREVAALTLDDVDWARDRLLVRDRKRDHTTAYPLAPAVGDAIVAYLKHGRPESSDRWLFFRFLAPVQPMTFNGVSCCARRYLLLAGVNVPRPGSHTLRHACAQRLLDAGFPLKTIGDYVGHSSTASTQVYTKVQIEQLREVALGDIEALS